MDIPKQIQDKLAQFQNLQNQMQMVGLQKQQLMISSKEMETAIDELGKINETDKVYKSAGPILISTNKSDSLKSLKEEGELASKRIQIIEKQEKKLNEKFNSLRDEIQKSLSGADTGG